MSETFSQSDPPPEPEVLVFVPSFNDAESLGDVVTDIRSLGGRYQILVIDDGSRPDAVPQGVDENVLLCRLPDNFGLGICTHIAFDHALKYGYRAVVRVDADGQHPVAEIPRLLEGLNGGDADVMVGNRGNQRTGNSLGDFSRWLAKLYFVWVARLITRGRSPNDVNTGFFAVNAKAVRILNRFQLERYPEPQIFVLACREGLRVNEIVVEQRERRYGTSTLTIMQAARLFYRFSIFILGELTRGRNK